MRWRLTWLIAACVLATLRAALADDPSLEYPPHPRLWHGPGTYAFDNLGIRVQVAAGQGILMTAESLPESLRPCFNEVAAVVHDPQLGLMFIGRTTTNEPVVGELDKVRFLFRANAKMGTEFERRVPRRSPTYEEIAAELKAELNGQDAVKQDDAKRFTLASEPVYEKSTGMMRWRYVIRSGAISWSASYWLTFDRDGYVTVFLMSRDSYSNPHLSPDPPITVELLEHHQLPLDRASPKAKGMLAGYHAAELDLTILNCAFRVPFGDSF